MIDRFNKRRIATVTAIALVVVGAVFAVWQIADNVTLQESPQASNQLDSADKQPSSETSSVSDASEFITFEEKTIARFFFEGDSETGIVRVLDREELNKSGSSPFTSPAFADDEVDVNDQLELVGLQSPPPGTTLPGGVLPITATFKNNGSLLTNLKFRVRTLEYISGGDPQPELVNHDAGTSSGTGAELTVALPEDGLPTGETITVTFEILLLRIQAFEFFVDAISIVQMFTDPEGRYSVLLPQDLIVREFPSKPFVTISQDPNLPVGSIQIAFHPNPEIRTISDFFDGDNAPNLFSGTQEVVDISVDNHPSILFREVLGFVGSNVVVVPITEGFIVVTRFEGSDVSRIPLDLILDNLSIP